MMGFSEVARATQTPDLSTQHHTPHHGVTEPATGPSAAEAGQAVLPGFGQDSSRTSSLCPGTLHRPALCPPLRGCPSSLGSAWDFGAQSHIPRPVAALLGPLPSHFRKSRTLYPNCLLPALPTLCRGGASAAQASEEQIICSLPAPFLGPLWAPLWKHHPASHLSCGSRFFGGSWQVAGSILSSASLILFMLVFTIWSGVPGQAAPPGVGRAVLFEPVRLDSTVPRPTEDTVMRDCLCPMLFYLLNLI